MPERENSILERWIMTNRRITSLLLATFIAGSILIGFACERMRRDKPATTDNINWLGYGDGFQQAAQQSKHLLVYFWRPGCSWCAKMENKNYADTSIANIINALFVPIKINGWSKDKFQTADGELSGTQLAEQFQIAGYPAVWFLESNGSRINVLPGYAPPDDFKLLLKYVGENHYKSKTWKDFARESGRVF